MTDLALKYGFDFAALYDRDGLVRLDREFIAQLASTDAALHERLMAGRADLVCLARPHLADPYWTLHAAAKLGDKGETWPAPYWAGRDQLHRLAESAEAAATSA